MSASDRQPAARRGRSGRGAGRRRGRGPKRFHSAGGVLFQEDKVVLIAIGSAERWQLPKGRIERGESPAQAAQREVREETGVEGEILEPLTTIQFSYQQRSGRPAHKKVDYFLMRYVSGSASDYDPGEVFEAGWFPWPRAEEILTFANERSVLKIAHRRWRERQDPTPGRAGAEEG